ncbi:DUF6688 domain-containing protein [Aquimarina longa]|uniref:DUF6688 domain-containing protein n=1 Tax=Aquimarina longa TaxID=1080221 RepID=UPI00078454C9|nr:DUF6688 family protein [Aquimarina longa]
MTILIPFILLVLFILFFVSFRVITKYRKGNTTILTIECILFVVYILSLFIFGGAYLFNSADYKIAIDPHDSWYTPFSENHILTLLVYFIFFMTASILIWFKGRELPPLILVMAMGILLIGSTISMVILLQVSVPITTNHYDISHGGITGFHFAPLLSIVNSVLLIIKIIKEESKLAKQRIYKNKFLNSINLYLSNSKKQTYWVIIGLFPILIIITLILVVFGQDFYSLGKVFTETTTWRFSQETHPPFLDYQGHYLCTVAACGNPKIVKPSRLGVRHGTTIIVNRQLLVANAFEDVIQRRVPKFHKMIRYYYDTYGYNLSKKINTPKRSNYTYILMKPLEFFFVIVLYLCCTQPEVLIDKQYRS